MGEPVLPPSLPLPLLAKPMHCNTNATQLLAPPPTDPSLHGALLIPGRRAVRARWQRRLMTENHQTNAYDILLSLACNAPHYPHAHPPCIPSHTPTHPHLHPLPSPGTAPPAFFRHPPHTHPCMGSCDLWRFRHGASPQQGKIESAEKHNLQQQSANWLLLWLQLLLVHGTDAVIDAHVAHVVVCYKAHLRKMGW
jgi:hypothetical protein